LPLKRKVGLFLLAVILTVTLGVGVIVSFLMYKLVSNKQDQEIAAIEKSLSERFAVFEAMLHSQHLKISAHMTDVLPLIAEEMDRRGWKPEKLTLDQMNYLAKAYGVEKIYFIDRSHTVFQTNFDKDMRLSFPPSNFTKFLDSVFGRNKVMDVGIDTSDETGALNVYSYFGPPGKDYILEASINIEASLAEGGFGWMSKYFFHDLFNDAIHDNAKVVDLYLVNDDGVWSLLNPGLETKLDPKLAARVVEAGRYVLWNRPLETIYSTDDSQKVTDAADPVRHVIRKVTYDTSLARDAVMKVVLTSLGVLAVTLPLVFLLASRLLQLQLLNPLLTLRDQARAIAAGDLDRAIADTDRRDEIGHLAASFATMRDSIRRTILDLKETNSAIERFVPRAFLSMMGKPSIVSVKLGDNTRRNMTVLFSDIRNFTGMSEKMTPDENFAFINAYLERMGPVIRAHNGFIDKYIGDAIMALFERADDALLCGLAMLDTLAAYNADRRAAGRTPIAIGIGINSGGLMMGTIGEQNRMDGTVISDAVNLAARIEGLTKTYGINLLISQYTYGQLADPKAHDIRPIDVVVVKGKTEPVTIYEVFARNEPADHAIKSRSRDLLISGIEALSRQDAVSARRMFEACLQLCPDDPAATSLLKRCA
jgi:class 3 adenylate cyclase